VRKRAMIAALEHPGLDRKVAVAGTPIKMTATPPGVRRRAPLLGEDAESVLAEIGYSRDEIAALAGAGVIVLLTKPGAPEK
jgi:crotonobetainyl-CoA:carnitine CoA-transferase CaiB-like acyl-CoA transferase